MNFVLKNISAVSKESGRLPSRRCSHAGGEFDQQETECFNLGRTVTNVDRTCGPTHLLVFSGNKICLN